VKLCKKMRKSHTPLGQHRFYTMRRANLFDDARHGSKLYRITTLDIKEAVT
jgi:hypothetical protein